MAACSSDKAATPATATIPVASTTTATASPTSPAATPPTVATPSTTAAGATTDGATSTAASQTSDAATVTTANPGPTTSAATPGTVPAPSGAAFYTPPTPIPGTANGDLIWATKIDGAVADATSWKVLYRSESVAGEPIAVSGLVIIPTTPAAGDPVITWAHGTTGLGDQCATSAQFTSGFSAEKLLAPVAIGRGWTFVATDYEGLGTPGVHPYLVGLSEARGVLDIVRAAKQVQGNAVTADSPVMIIGHSQGGGAALFAAEQAATYAPELHVVGTAAGAPAGNLDVIAKGSWNATATNPFGAELIAGFHAAYPDLPMDAVVNASGAKVIDEVGTQCLDATSALGITPVEVGAQDPTLNPAWAKAIHDNTAGFVDPSAPVMIFHGEADTTVPRALTDLTLADYCKVGATVEVRSYPGATHTSVIAAALGDILAFLDARLAGQPPTSSCPT
ncbi:MAG: lipase family protein [Ilumatobacteraceae bacterium]